MKKELILWLELQLNLDDHMNVLASLADAIEDPEEENFGARPQ